MLKVDIIKGQLLDYIRCYRSSGQFRLPTERQLALEFGCSRSTVGKALGILAAEGLVDRRASSGTYIVDSRSSSPTIAVLMQNAYQCTDTHFRLLIDTLSSYADELGLQIKICDYLIGSFERAAFREQFLASIKDGSISGLLVASRMPIKILAWLHSLCPIISINNIFAQGHEIPGISCDYFRVGFLGGKYLLEQGHRRIAFLTESLAHPESALDLSGLRSAMEMYGLELTPADILESRLNLNLFSSAVRTFFQKRQYSACFVRSTSLALPTLAILNQDSIRVPQDLSIIAAGNYQPERQQQTQLTTIDNQLAEMCKQGLQLLKMKISDQSKQIPSLTLLEPKLQIRDSVVPYPKTDG
jgi:LacI family purine nucleotide synthesis repressor